MTAPLTEIAVNADPARAGAIYAKEADKLHRGVDGMFLCVLLAEWIFAILLAALTSPFSWDGGKRAVHIHMELALVFGFAINALPLWLIRARPGSLLTRFAISLAQGLWSGLLIHLSGGRIETHFHIFGSLAMLAFYRDWRVLVPATLLISADHFIRGIFFPESIFGISRAEEWRFLEHVAWVVFEDVFLVVGCMRADRELHVAAMRSAKIETASQLVREASLITETEVVKRTLELEESREQYRLIAEGTDAIPFAYTLKTRCFTYVGPQAARLFGWPLEEWLLPEFRLRFFPRDQGAMLTAAIEGARDGERLQLEARANSASGTPIVLRLIMNVSRNNGSTSLIGLMLDITELRNLESELRQAQKLESVGRLAAGVAHEINTPVQFVSDSIHFVQKGMRDLLPLLGAYQELETSVSAGTPSQELAAKLAEERDFIDLAYLLKNVPGALDRSLEGLDRVADIVSSMKEFAHPDQKEMSAVNLNRAVESTLTIARGEYKLVADAEMKLGEIPLVQCHGGEINQVLLNIIVNAAHAIEDVVRGTETRGAIRIATSLDGDDVVISISDTGGGIPASIAERIFDPFFTTKEVGRGTGQGLAIARSVVQEKHAGTLTFTSTPGVGTTFRIRLPIAGKPVEAAPAVAAAPAAALRPSPEPVLMIG